MPMDQQQARPARPFSLASKLFGRQQKQPAPLPAPAWGPTEQEAHRQEVGGNWELMGRAQFDFLVGQGLQPQHRLLDVGCGSLRGGVHFIQYLADGNYYGIDKQQWLLDAGQNVELPRYGLQGKTVHLAQTECFEVGQFDVRFDYALAQSVFTHLPLNNIIRCLINVSQVLAPGGRFYATFFENPAGKRNLEPVLHPGGVTTYFDQDPFHYDFGAFVDICRGLGLRAQRLGLWGHPYDQLMLVFHRQR